MFRDTIGTGSYPRAGEDTRLPAERGVGDLLVLGAGPELRLPGDQRRSAGGERGCLLQPLRPEQYSAEEPGREHRENPRGA